MLMGPFFGLRLEQSDTPTAKEAQRGTPTSPRATRTRCSAHPTDLLHLPLGEAGPTADAAWGGPLLLGVQLGSRYEAAVGACHGAAKEKEKE